MMASKEEDSAQQAFAIDGKVIEAEEQATLAVTMKEGELMLASTSTGRTEAEAAVMILDKLMASHSPKEDDAAQSFSFHGKELEEGDLLIPAVLLASGQVEAAEAWGTEETAQTKAKAIDNDDPFAMFGDEYEEDKADEIPDNENSRIARSLVDMVNSNSYAKKENSPASVVTTLAASTRLMAESTKLPTIQETFSIKYHGKDPRQGQIPHLDEVVSEKELTIPWRKPLYLGPIKLLSSLPYGGGRGYVAARDIPPGTLLLVEEPLFTWPLDQIGKKLSLVSVQHIFCLDEASKTLHEMEHFHPTKRAVDGHDDEESVNHRQVADMIRKSRAWYQDDDSHALEELTALAEHRGLLNSDGTCITATDCLRLLLALRYNGLESGVYLHVAMLNHADQPNCVKFLPPFQVHSYSEVRTTRAVQAGQPLTISYVPSGLCHASRRRYLWKQHRFDIGAEMDPLLRRMELVGGQLPASSLNRWDPESSTHRIEQAIAELRRLHHIASEDHPTDAQSKLQHSNHVKALEQAALELCRQAKEQLQNPYHVLLVPCLEMHLDSVDLVERSDFTTLSGSHRMLLLSRLVLTALQLVERQELFLGPDHFDLAKTYLELAQAIEELLSKSANHLLQLGLQGYGSVSTWSAIANICRAEFSRIQNLYPTDTEDWIRRAAEYNN